ncbi:MAG: hypothetical protein KDE52_03470 [Calditrichaeota bacterium]|nr:hypothetical protein [Calditrichota bacterium]
MPVVFNPANTEAPDYFCGYVIIQPEFRIGDQSIQEKMQGRAAARPFVKNLFKKRNGTNERSP